MHRTSRSSLIRLCCASRSSHGRTACRGLKGKIAEYFRMGVRAAWIIDAKTQTGYQSEGPTLQEWKPSAILIIPGTPIRLELSALIADLD
jgi:Uma2 family endonuclease